jgi:hypothetical protein
VEDIGHFYGYSQTYKKAFNDVSPITEVVQYRTIARCMADNEKLDNSVSIVTGMNCLRSLEHWDLGFEFNSRHGCLRLICVCVLLCVGSGLATG